MRGALNPSARVALAALREVPPGEGVTTAALVAATGLTRAAVGSALVRLEADGVVHGQGRAWRLTAFGRLLRSDERGGAPPPPDAPVADDSVLRSVARLTTLRATRYARALPDAGLAAIARRARAAASADLGLVTLLDDERCLLAATAPASVRYRLGEHLPVAHSLCRETVVRGVPVLIPDTKADGRARGYLAVERLGIGAYAGVPLTVRGQVLGALCVVSRRPRPLEPRLVRALEALATEAEALLRAGRPGAPALAA